MKEHRGPVKVTKFHPDNTKILSCSDDRLVKVWDIPSQAAISTFDDHNDYVRCGTINPANPNVYLSGSYDNTVKIYDARNPASSACILTLDHGAPVEDVLVYPTGSLLAVAGGPCVKIYDIITGRCLHNLENFQKTVTCLALDGEKVRLLAGSLDHHVKVYDLSEYSMQHSVKYPSPVLSLAISGNNSTLAVGMVSGALSIRKRITTGTSRSSSVAFKEEVVTPEVSAPTKKKSKNPHDRLIRDFKYKEALDSLLMTPNSNDLTMELLRELIRRGGIEVALSGRDDASLLMLLKFLANNFNHVEYHSLILNVIILTLDIYDKVITSSNKLNKVLIQLKDKVQSELTLQKEMVAVSGLAEMVKAKAMTK
ncbi:WD40 repeat-like protein [Neoconidiobolus thromboides FSU 785]|nr:WD40 repeat-like protein [Neoconidiobolus thromboides FSU 785]